MPCIPIPGGVVCVGNEPIEVGGGKYRVEWTSACGWVPVNKDGSERRSPLPAWVWEEIERLPRPGSVPVLTQVAAKAAGGE